MGLQKSISAALERLFNTGDGRDRSMVGGIVNNTPLQWRNTSDANVSVLNLDASSVTQLSNGANIPTGKTLTDVDAGTHRLNRPRITGSVDDANGIQRAVLNPTAKTIADTLATSLFEVACAAGVMVGGAILYQVEASDGTDHQALTGMVTYAAVNKAGTLTLAITEVAGNQAKALSNGLSTLTLAWTFVTGINKGTVKLQPTGSLTETTFRVTYTVLPFVGAVTIL